MIGSLADFGGLKLFQRPTVRAVRPIGPATVFRDRRERRRGQHVLAAAALAPAAMWALIAAQESEGQDAPPADIDLQT